MSTTLRDFVLNAVEMNRIRFADLRRLQRDILPYHITRREEVEMLLSLDATVERADRDWRNYLVPAVAQFAVWGLEPWPPRPLNTISIASELDETGPELKPTVPCASGQECRANA